MNVQYGDACLSLQRVYEWSRKLPNGVTSVTDAPRPGQAHRVVTPEDTAAVEAIVNENRSVTVNEIAEHLDMGHGSAQHIVHDVLQFCLIYRVIQEESAILWEMTVCVILSKKVHMNMVPILNGYGVTTA